MHRLRVPGGAAVLLPAAVLAGLLLGQLSADPAAGVTFSNSPFTDEAWNVMAARNAVLLGDWAAGNWALHLVQLPFTLLEAAGFALLGVGILQARLVATLCTLASVALIGLVVGRRLGAGAGVVAGAALGSCALLLFYGRLVYIENLVLLGLAGGIAALAWRPGAASWAGAALGGVLLAVAIGSKPLALFSVIGILAGTALGAWSRAWTLRVLVASAVIGLAGIAWLLLIGLPNSRQIGWVREIWAQQSAPADLGQMIGRVLSYPTAGDRAVLLSLPLSLAGIAGLGCAVLGWRALDRGQRALAGAAMGWLVLGLGVLLVASYRPSRYALPYLPALAVLAGFAVPVAARLLARVPTAVARGALAGAVAGLLIGPGLASYAGWAARTDHRAAALQAEIAGLMAQDPRPIEGGLAPFFAMRVPVPIYVRWSSSRVNSGDLYAEEDVRWMLLTGTQHPLWADAHPEAWEGRRELGCYAWGEGRHCLLRFP
ncbi:MAG TPA: hypothetical protein VHK28_07640 [Candidatus Limnocylindria bacterium]|nr:hypothetical protein [Candidatus Limnocylindria bacterium]